MKTRLEKMVINHEGFRQHIYRCTAGHQTIGYGFNLDVGFSEEESFLILRHRLEKLKEQLAYLFPWFNTQAAIRQAVLVDMAYNMGVSKLLGFRKTLACFAEGDYKGAAREMLDSEWAQQVGQRAERLAQMVEFGTDAVG